MGIFFDYFRAGTDDEALAVHDWPAGPTCPPEGTEPKDSVEIKGIDPHVMMGTLEALLTGHRYEDITDRPGHARELTISDEGGQAVFALADEFAVALAAAGDEEIRAVADPWSRTEEFWGNADPAELAEIVSDLRDLAVRAVGQEQHLYCWMSL
ncbi:hypothetical protein [Microbispora sp. H10885]|uniref:hypothetical protein n=1 Tax=Microbispora sp. H10885 TaxID=2729110 RepID=UPI001601F21D|nr:hypothetical protein [Microbispora sp. H10885]